MPSARPCRWIAATACALALGCASVPVVPSQEREDRQRLADADALLRAGCHDCLVDAYHRYATLRESESVGGAAVLGAGQAAILADIRQRELALPASADLPDVRTAVASVPDPTGVLPGLLELADSLPPRLPGRPHPEGLVPSTRRSTLSREARTTLLASSASTLPALTAYLRQAYDCRPADGVAAGTEADDNDARGNWRATPLVRFAAATCDELDPVALADLLTTDPRMIDVELFLGIRAVNHGDLDAGLAHFDGALAWQPTWPLATFLVAQALADLEDFEQAAAYYDRTIALAPEAPDALLGSARTLAELARYEDSLTVVDRLLALGGWYPGDARYLRAWDELQLGRYDEAWTDVEIAGRSLVTARVAKLAGIIAYRRRDLEVARTRLETSRGRDPRDCETGFYLGVVLNERQQWRPALDVLREVEPCLLGALAELRATRLRIASSEEPAARRSQRLARVDRRLAGTNQILADARWHRALASFQLGETDQAPPAGRAP